MCIVLSHKLGGGGVIGFGCKTIDKSKQLIPNRW